MSIALNGCKALETVIRHCLVHELQSRIGNSIGGAGVFGHRPAPNAVVSQEWA